MELGSYMQEKKKVIDQFLEEKLPSENQNPSLIHRSMRYSVLNGGKRIRPILTIMTAELLDQPSGKVLPAAAGIELIHTFSLIHDDLPCMDNDDYRRGKLTNHKVFGEAIAVLTGDALLVLGLDFISNNCRVRGVSKASVFEAIKYILEMLGSKKMLGGQVDDISWKHYKENPRYIEDIYRKKTSALICASLKTGALLSQANKEQIESLVNYGEKMGLAFQIIDDLLDLKQDDKEKDKPTYPGIFGIEKANKVAQEYTDQAKEYISLFGKKAKLFYELADFIINRQK
ncbi:MAG: polyprenyl synthetase family protein [Elusimicrobiota bacterium]